VVPDSADEKALMEKEAEKEVRGREGGRERRRDNCHHQQGA